MNPQQLRSWARGMNDMGRPFLTALVTTIYNLALLIALVMGDLKVMEYVTAVGPTNAMIIGFWFGERKGHYDTPSAACPGPHRCIRLGEEVHDAG